MPILFCTSVGEGECRTSQKAVNPKFTEIGFYDVGCMGPGLWSLSGDLNPQGDQGDHDGDYHGAPRLHGLNRGVENFPAPLSLLEDRHDEKVGISPPAGKCSLYSCVTAAMAGSSTYVTSRGVR